MNMMRTYAPLALAGFILGCSGDPDDAVVLVPVTGKITIDGQPMAGATVSFLPDASGKSNVAGIDSTGPDGSYKLKWKKRTGITPGKYRVVVTTLALPAGTKVPEGFENDPFGAQMALGNPKPGEPLKKLPGAKNEFEADVPAQGGAFDFDVKSGSPAAAPKKK